MLQKPEQRLIQAALNAVFMVTIVWMLQTRKYTKPASLQDAVSLLVYAVVAKEKS